MAAKKPITPEQRKKAQKKLAILGGLAVTFLVLNFVYQLWRHYQTPPTTPPPPTQVACDLHQNTCSVVLPKNRGLAFSIEPKTAPIGEPVTLLAKLTNLPATSVSFYVLAVGIKDQKRQILEATHKGDSYQATVTFTDTKKKNQPWMIMVVVKTDNETIGVPFKVTTNN